MEEPGFRYDIGGLAEDLDVEIGEIANLYLNYFFEMKSEKADMKAFLENKDWNMLERTVHNIKGVSANLYVTDVYEASADFLKLLRQNETGGASERIDKIISLLDNAETDIKNYFLNRGVSL